MFLFFQANQGLNIKEFCVRLLITGFCFHTYQQVTRTSYSLYINRKLKLLLVPRIVSIFSIFVRAGLVYDTADGITGHTRSRELCEESGGHSFLSHLLPNTSLTHKLTR